MRRTLCLAGLLAVAAVLPQPARAAGGASVSGTLVNGTSGQPIVGQEVVLNTYRGEAEGAKRTTTTEAGGRFTFTELESGAPLEYMVQASYQGADYQTDRLQLTGTETKAVELTAYDATSSPENLTIGEWIVWLDRRGGVTIQQDVAVDNFGKTTFVGDEDLPGDKKAVMRLPIATGARDMQYLGLFMECCAIVRGTTFIHTMAIAPGTSKGTVSHTAPSLKSFSFPVLLPTRSFTLLAPDNVGVRSATLRPGPSSTDQGVTYRAYTATDLKKGTTVEVSLTGLEARGIPPAVVALFGIAAAAAVALAMVLLRSRGDARPRRARTKKEPRSRPRTSPARKPAPKPARTAAPEGRRAEPPAPPRAEEPSRAPAEDRGLLLDEIAALDLAFERGLLAEETYHRLRDAAKRRLVALRSDERESTSP